MKQSQSAADAPTWTPHPVQQLELARRMGCSRSVVTDRLRGTWAAARLPNGRVDAAHPAVVAVAIARGVDPTALLDPIRALPPDPKPREPDAQHPAEPAQALAPANDDEPELAALLDMSLREITDKYPTAQSLQDWLETRKLAAETSRLESRNARDEGRLVPREHVRTHVLGHLTQLHLRLLDTFPRTAGARVLAAAKSGATLEEVVELLRGCVSNELGGIRARVAGSLAAAHATDNPPPVGATPPPAAGDARLRAFAVRAKTRLATIAAPKLVEEILKDVGRAAASGATWNAALFAEVMSTHATIEPSATKLAAGILAAHIDHALAADASDANEVPADV